MKLSAYISYLESVVEDRSDPEVHLCNRDYYGPMEDRDLKSMFSYDEELKAVLMTPVCH